MSLLYLDYFEYFRAHNIQNKIYYRLVIDNDQRMYSNYKYAFSSDIATSPQSQNNTNFLGILIYLFLVVFAIVLCYLIYKSYQSKEDLVADIGVHPTEDKAAQKMTTTIIPGVNQYQGLTTTQQSQTSLSTSIHSLMKGLIPIPAPSNSEIPMELPPGAAMMEQNKMPDTSVIKDWKKLIGEAIAAPQVAQMSPSSELLSSVMTVQESSKSNIGPIPTLTKTHYNKYDEIILPSSVANPYIGRDHVCFRQKTGDHNFVGKRSGCMACQVDQEGKKYDGTNTNVIATCVYAENSDDYDDSVWTKSKCESRCALLKDL